MAAQDTWALLGLDMRGQLCWVIPAAQEIQVMWDQPALLRAIPDSWAVQGILAVVDTTAVADILVQLDTPDQLATLAVRATLVQLAGPVPGVILDLLDQQDMTDQLAMLAVRALVIT
jgi:hypothetical protein